MCFVLYHWDGLGNFHRLASVIKSIHSALAMYLHKTTRIVHVCFVVARALLALWKIPQTSTYFADST